MVGRCCSVTARWPHDVVMRAEHGVALRLSAEALQETLADHPEIRTVLLRFVGVLMTQMSQDHRIVARALDRTADGTLDPALSRSGL